VKRSLVAKLEPWLAAGERIALATVVQATGSSPRLPGSCMVVSARGGVIGSISGGCVDGAVFEEAQTVLASGSPKRLPYLTTDDADLEIGLACGGSIEVYIEPLVDVHRRAVELLKAGEGFGLATRLGGGHLLASPSAALEGDTTLAAELGALLPGPVAVLRERDGEAVFFEVFATPPTVVIIGAVHVAASLASMAQELGFRVQIVDPRRTFATRERFPTVDELTLAWPQDALRAEDLGASHHIVVLSHDPKLDLPALEIALRSRAAYIGLIGARSTQADRRRALAEAGFDAATLARIHGPVGLDLGGREPAEIALAILAEIVAVRHGRSGGMLN
jgi:xanthine dehydrogenase accessory factor